MHLILFIFVLFFSKCNGCFPTEGGGAPEIPLCATCGDLPVLPAPTSDMIRDNPGGTVTVGMTGVCKSYAIFCPESDTATNAVVIGANGAANALSAFGPGEKTATVVCNDQGEIEGRTVPAGDSIIVTDVYCSRNNA
uniref:Uncharacterized protein n=1 Tax=Panagrolaimus sp. ES5 TaxID=591445 RepID=A0AC34GNE6_9BILA